MGNAPTGMVPECDPELAQRVGAWLLGIPPDAGSGASTSSDDDRVQDSEEQDQGPHQYIDDNGCLRLSSMQEQSQEELGLSSASGYQAELNEYDPEVEPGPAEHNTQRYSRTGMTGGGAHNPGEQTTYPREQVQSRLNLLADEFEEPGAPVEQSTPVQQRRGKDKGRRKAFFQKMKDGLRKLRK